MIVWRISNYADLSGRGGFLQEGRWNKARTPVVYCSETPTGAMVEMLAHLNKEEMPKTYQLLEIDIPEHHVWNFENACAASNKKDASHKAILRWIDQHIIDEKKNLKLKEDVQFLCSQKTDTFDWLGWFRMRDDLTLSQAIGGVLLTHPTRMRSFHGLPAFKVPSAIMPYSWNVLINPNSAYIQEIKIISNIRYPFDRRLAS